MWKETEGVCADGPRDIREGCWDSDLELGKVTMERGQGKHRVKEGIELGLWDQQGWSGQI